MTNKKLALMAIPAFAAIMIGATVMPMAYGNYIGSLVDIKPQSCPNSINIDSKGLLPVAILGTDFFDVTQIDIASLQLEGVSPVKSSFEDVATPYLDELIDQSSCHELGPDGYLDLNLKFDTQEIAAALGSVNDGDVIELAMTGSLLDGSQLDGSDIVIIRAK